MHLVILAKISVALPMEEAQELAWPKPLVRPQISPETFWLNAAKFLMDAEPPSLAQILVQLEALAKITVVSQTCASLPPNVLHLPALLVLWFTQPVVSKEMDAEELSLAEFAQLEVTADLVNVSKLTPNAPQPPNVLILL